jgi:hypothetical protein
MPTIRSLAAALAFAFTLLFAPVVSGAAPLARSPAVAASGLKLFDTEAAAQAHCLKDTVVCLITNSGVYHEKGMRWHANTKQNAFVCRREADAAVDCDTRKGE